MTFQPWKLCECCRSKVATSYVVRLSDGLTEALCTQCYLKLQRVKAEARRDVDMQRLEAMWELDGSWVKEGQVMR